MAYRKYQVRKKESVDFPSVAAALLLCHRCAFAPPAGIAVADLATPFARSVTPFPTKRVRYYDYTRRLCVQACSRKVPCPIAPVPLVPLLIV